MNQQDGNSISTVGDDSSLLKMRLETTVSSSKIDCGDGYSTLNVLKTSEL